MADLYESAAQTASDDGAQGPTKVQQQEVKADGRVVVKPATTTPSNADTAATTDSGGGDSGTNPPTTTQETTQSIQNPGGSYDGIPVATTPDPGGDYSGGIPDASTPLSNAGTSPGDDAASNALVQQEKDLNTNYNASESIKPQPNVLDKFASYTYSASVYLMTPQQYERLLATKKKTVNGYNLLFQSGGAPNNVGGARGQVPDTAGTQLFDTEAQATAAAAKTSDAGRNPAFPNDFYIDSIVMENALPGKATGAAHMVTTMKINVVEPSNITLLDRLYQAVQDHVPKDGAGAINYTAVTYLLVLRWYGYDQNGNLISGAKSGPDGTSDNNAVIEKFIPFVIKKINWGVSNKLVNYEFECAAVGQLIAGTTRRGTIPYDVELSASTVGNLLGSNVKFATSASKGPNQTSATEQRTGVNLSNTAAGGGRGTGGNAGGTPYQTPAPNSAPPPKATATPSDKKTITQGLMGAMNEFQESLVDRKIYQRADTYNIVWAKGAEKIRDAKLVLPGKNVNTSSTPMAKPSTKETQSLDPAKVAMDISVRNFSITAGQQLLQAIDLAIRNSSYISDQALVVENEDGTSEVKDSARNNPVKWYQISMSAVPKKYDTLRNDYAYDITFTISPYELQHFDSKYFPLNKFKGVHKQYPYWFTGMNSSVLDFQQNFNTLYNITITGDSPENSGAAQIRKKYTSSMREMPFYTYQAGSTESRIGAELKGNEVAANAAEYLYNPGDMGKAKIRIVGDPAWIQQGSIFAGVNAENFNYSAFNPDGTINFDSQQVMFEIAWQRPEDYDLGTGLADPYARSGGKREPIQSNIYLCTKVTSEFRQGRFEQILEGNLYMFPIPDGKNKAPGAANSNSNESNAETQRLARQAQTTRGTPTQTVTAQVASTENVTSARLAPGAADGVTTGDPGGDYSGGLTDNISNAAPPADVSSNGENVSWFDYEPPKKLGESDAPTVGTADLGDFFG